jgi:anti-sigma factor RsiW
MLTCRELAEALGDVVDGELAAEHRVAVERHLDHCPDCRILMETYRLTITLARRLEPPPLPAGFLARLQQQLGGRAPAPGP